MASGDCSGSTRHDSEKYVTQECNVCKQDDIRKQATVYCPDCEEYLCNKCLDWHKKLKASKTHEVKPVSERKSSTGKVQPKVKSVKNWCSCNQREEVSELCIVHNELACSVCMKVKHRSCKRATIDQMISDTSVVPAFNEIFDEIKWLVDKTSDLKSDHATCMRKLVEIEQSCRHEINSFRTFLNDWLIKLEQDALVHLHKRIKEQKYNIEEGNDSLESTVQLLNADMQLLEDITKTHSKRQMFIACNKIQKSLHDYYASMEHIESKLIVPRTEFERNKKFSSIEQECDCLGEIRTENIKYKALVKAGVLDAVCNGTETVCVKDDSDSGCPWITGISFLNNGELLIVDRSNLCLKKFDSTLTLTDSIKCNSNPWDIAVVDDMKVLVSFPESMIIQYFPIEPKLQVGRSIKLSGYSCCWGVVVKGNRIYVCQYGGGSPGVLVLDLNGTELNKITQNQTYVQFQCPCYVTSNSSGNKLYLSDFRSNQLTCMTTEGKYIFTYSKPDLKAPAGIVLDEDDNILLVGEHSNNIHVIKSDGTKHKVLLSSTEGVKSPSGMAYCPSNRKLYVGGYNKDLMIFSL